MRTITIIGGGIAGLSLGIALRQKSVPVKLVEAKPYPHHKVCGEVISGRGLDLLLQLGLDPLQLGIPIESITFHCRTKVSRSRPLPRRAVAIPRFDLDSALMSKFVALGGDLNCPCRFQSAWDEGYVCATGRRLAKRGKSKWYGLKGHIQNFTLMSDLELHFVNDGYIGLCNVGNRWTNVCGLFRRSHEAPSAPGDFLEHFQREPSIQNRLLDACWQQESLVATAGLPIEHDEDGEPGQFAVGDAFSMIPPFTGNGMSLAIESALLAVSPLVNYARDAVSWSETTTAYQSARHSRFHHRIRFARRVQKLLVSQPFKSALSLFINFTPLWRSVFSATR